MFRNALFLLGLSLSALPAHSQTVSDAALEECQNAHESFTAVKDCLPQTHVAIAMIEHVGSEEFYGDAGQIVTASCRENNDSSEAVWACVSNAISDAVELLEMVGSTEKIEDARFHGISDPQILERLNAQLRTEREPFDLLIWGGSMYHPMR